MKFIPEDKTRKKALTKKKLEKRVLRFADKLGNLCRKQGVILGFNDGFVFFESKDERILRTGASLGTAMLFPSGGGSFKCRMIDTGKVYLAGGRFLERKVKPQKKEAPIHEKV